MKKEFEKESANPLYLQLVEKIKQNIKNGTYQRGRRLPSEVELGDAFKVSRITVRRALEELENEEIIVRKQGKGTFIAEERKNVANADLRPVTSFHEACARLWKKPSTRVIHARSMPAQPGDIRNLGLPNRSRIVETMRVRLADGVPVIFEINHFSMGYSYLVESELSGSLYQLLSQYGIEPCGAEREVSLVPASALVAGNLEIEVGTTLLLLTELVFDQKGRPLHTSRQYIRGDIFTIKL